MTDIAQLGIAVDATQPAKATKTLEDMAVAGGKAEDSTKKLTTATETLAGAAKKVSDSLGTAEKNTTTLEQSTRRANASIDEASNKTVAFISALERQIAVHGKSATEVLKYDAALLGVSRAQQEHISNLIRMSEEQNRLLPKQQSAIDQLKQMAVAVGLVALAWKAFDYLKEATLLNARYETLGVSMTVVGRNAGYTAQQMEAAAVAMQKTGISMLESRKGAMQLVQAHIDLADSTKLARIAQDAAVIGGINSSEAFGRMVHGIQSAQVEVLRTIGINVQFEQGYAQMAHTLHKTADQLTENEKSQSRLNQVLEKGKDIAGTYEAAMDTAGKQILSMQRYVEDAKVQLGGLFNEALTIAVMAYTDHLKETNKEMGNLTKNGDIKAWGAGVADVFALVADGAIGIVSMLQTIGAATIWLANTTVDAAKRMKNPFDGQDEQGTTNKAFTSMVNSIWANSDKMRNALEARRATLAEQNEKDKRIEQSIAEDRLGRFAGDHHHYSDTPAIPKEHKGASPYEQLIGSLKEKIAVERLDIESQDKLTAGEKLRSETLAKMEAGLLKLTATQKSVVAAKFEVLIGLEKEKIAEDKALASAMATAKARSDMRQKEEAAIKAYSEAQTAAFHAAEQHDRDALKSEEAKLAQYGMTRSQIAELTIAELELKKARVTAGSEEYESLERQIAIRKRLVGVIKEVENLDASKAVWQSIESTAHTTFTNIFQGGQDAFTKLRDTLKSTLLDLLYQMTVKKWIFNIAASVSGENVAGAAFGAMGGGASGGTGGLSGLSSLSSLYSYGSKAIDIGRGWLGMGSSISTAAPAISAASTASTGAVMGGIETGGAAGIGSGTAMGGAGAASSGSMAGFAGIPIVGWIMMGMMASADAYDKGFRNFNKGGEGYTVSDGGLMGPNGMIGGIDKALTGMGLDPKVAAILSGSALGQQAMYTVLGGYKVSPDGAALTGTLKAGGTSDLQTRTDFTQDHRGPLGIGSYTTHNSEYAAASSGTTGYVDAATSIVTASVKHYAEALGLSASAVDGFTSQINVSLTGLDPEAQKAAIDKAITGFMNEMVTSVYGADITSLQKPGEESSATLVRLATNLDFVNGGLKSLDMALLPVSLSSAAWASKLVDAAGGAEKLSESVTYLYDHFYSDSEKAANASDALSAAFAKLGYDTVPATHAAFLQLIGAIDPLAEGSAATTAGLLALAPAFDVVAANAQAAANKMLGALADYGTPDEVRAFTVGMIQNKLADAGLNYSTDQIANASRADYRAEYERLVAAGNSRGADALLDQAKAFASITKAAEKATVAIGGGSSGGGGGGGGGVSAALDALASAAKSAMESIFQEVARIRGLVIADNGPSGYAEAQANLYTTNAMANAGDTNAMAALPRLAQAMLALAEKNETSLFNLQFVRAQTAAMLEKTGTKIAGDNGFSIPSYSAGTEFVQFDQVAKIHAGEAVITAGDNVSMKEELFNMRVLLEKALTELEDIARDSKRTADVTEKSDAIGPAPARATL